MATITTRASKGAPLSWDEADANFTNLNNDKIEAASPSTLTNKTVNLTSNTLTGTKAQFDTACSDDNFAYVGQANTFTQDQTISSGNLSLSGTGQRITGDFSNATIANRVMFQTSTVSSGTLVGLCPTTYGASAGVQFYNTPIPGSGINSIFDLRVVGTVDCRLQAMYEGSGAPLPMTFWTGGSERMRIDTNGNVGIGVSPNVNWGSGFKALELGYSGSVLSVNTINGNTAIRGNLYDNASSQSIYANTGFAAAVQVLPSSGIIQLITFPSASAGAVAAAAVASFQVSQTDCTMITPNGGLGYGTGAGGTVTQATSKATAVTLNKPTGQITMNNAALAANTTVAFQFNNSLLTASDTLSLSILNGSVAAGQSYIVTAGIAAGACQINLRNLSAGSLSEAVVINFAIIKGATS